MVEKLPDPANMTQAECVEYINNVRSMYLDDPESVDDEVLRHSLSVLRHVRANTASTKPKKAAQPKKQVSLSDF